MKRELPLLFLLMLVSAGWYLACRDNLQVGQHSDDASYVTLGRALATGQGYRLLCYPGEPYEAKYPPLLPAMIALGFRLLGFQLWVARLPALLCAMASVPLLWALLRRLLGPGWPPLLLTALMSLHPVLVGYAGMAMTETPALLLTWAAFLLFLQAEDSELKYGWAGLLIGVGLLLRMDFIFLLAALLLVLVMQRRPGPALLLLAPALIVSSPWVLHMWRMAPHVGVEQNYMLELQSGWWDRSPFPLRYLHGVRNYLGDAIPNMVSLLFGSTVEAKLSAFGLGPVVAVTKWLIGLLIVLGAVVSWRKLPRPINVFVVLRQGVLFGWLLLTRYLLPILPFLYLYLAGSLQWLVELARRPREASVEASQRRFRGWVAGLSLILLFPALGRDALLIVQPPRTKYADLPRGGALMERYTPPNAIVLVSWSAKSFSLYAHRKVQETTWSPQGHPLEEMLSHAGRATHLLVVREPERPLDLERFLHSPRLKLVAQAPEGDMWLFELRR